MGSPANVDQSLDFSNQVLAAFVRYAEKDKTRLNSLLTELKVDLEWLHDENQWHSSEFLEKFLVTMRKIYGLDAIHTATLEMYTAGNFKLGDSALGLLITPGVLFSALPKMVKRMNVYNTYTLSPVQTGLDRTTFGLNQYYRDSHRHDFNCLMCTTARASIEGIVKKLNYRLLALTEDKCVHKGDDHCEYKIVWVNRISLMPLTFFALIVLGVVLSRGLTSFDFLHGASISVADFLVVSAGIGFLYHILYNRKFMTRLNNAFDYQQGMLEKLRDLLVTERNLNRSLVEFQEQYQRALGLARLGEISYGIIHDMASPITVIQMGSGTLNDKIGSGQEVSSEEVAKVFNVIKKSTDRLVKLQNLLRKTVKSENTNKNVNINVRTMLAELIMLFETIARHKEIEINLEIEMQGQEVINSSEYHIERCIANAIQNALNALKASPVRKLIVRAFRQDNNVVFEVSDTGPGFPEAMKKNLFAQFGHSSNSTGDIGGSGFGLYSMRQMIEEIKGTIEIDSEPGQGSTVRFIAADHLLDELRRAS